jgi:nitrite reductase/ring-hydroxylating ferredoxin subunit/uncharacterized membrane protein
VRSAAHIKGHPIHPALIPFPLAFLAGSALFDLGGTLLDRPALWTVGGWLALAGVATALLAAIPGFIDYLKTVPPRSSAKERATKHMIIMLSVVAVFAAACVMRGAPGNQPHIIVVGMKLAGMVLLGVGGWMGGTLVSRNQISVDHRYAEAGRWNEATFDAQPGKPVIIASKDELELNQMKLVHVGGKRVVLARTEKGLVAFDDRCTHKGGSLAGGVMMCGTVQCPWHGSQFSVTTGAVTCGPATAAVKSYRIELKGDDVALTI